MSNPSKGFECRWQASGQLLAAYLSAQAFALGALFSSDLALWVSVPCALLCLLHGLCVIPRQITLNHSSAFTGLRRDESGWQLWNVERGWQAIRLRRDSLALPMIIVLRFHLRNERRARSVCVPRDALAPQMHQRLRVRLKFSRRRWAAPE